MVFFFWKYLDVRWFIVIIKFANPSYAWTYSTSQMFYLISIAFRLNFKGIQHKLTFLRDLVSMSYGRVFKISDVSLCQQNIVIILQIFFKILIF